MQCEHEHNLELAVIEAFAREPGTTADEIAKQLGCHADEVRETKFYKRVLISRIARDPNAVADFAGHRYSA